LVDAVPANNADTADGVIAPLPSTGVGIHNSLLWASIMAGSGMILTLIGRRRRRRMA
jgi:LPXTG-motif cell wall-anchored protein